MKNFKKEIKDPKAITIIALVVTIVILLIISTAAITLLVNNNLISQGKYAVDKYNNSANEENAELARLTNEIENLSSSREDVQVASNPAGTIIAYAANTAPDGYLACNGQEVSRTEYAKLFEVIGTTYGEGDGSTTFKVPELTGKFLKGSSTAGVSENAGLPNITGTLSTWVDIGRARSGALSYSNADTGYEGAPARSGTKYNRIIFDASASNSIYGASTTVTPANVSVFYCIKY